VFQHFEKIMWLLCIKVLKLGIPVSTNTPVRLSIRLNPQKTVLHTYCNTMTAYAVNLYYTYSKKSGIIYTYAISFKQNTFHSHRTSSVKLSVIMWPRYLICFKQGGWTKRQRRNFLRPNPLPLNPFFMSSFRTVNSCMQIVSIFSIVLLTVRVHGPVSFRKCFSGSTNCWIGPLLRSWRQWINSNYWIGPLLVQVLVCFGV